MKNILTLASLFLAFQSTGGILKLNPENPDELHIGVEQSYADTQIKDVEFLIEDINEKESVTKEYIDEDNTIHTVQIEVDQVPNTLLSSRNLANKTYTITHTKNLNYKASFKIDIVSNKIQRAHSSSITLYRGSLSNNKLVRVSATKAQQTFNQKLVLTTIKNSINATVTDGKIKVTVTP